MARDLLLPARRHRARLAGHRRRLPRALRRKHDHIARCEGAGPRPDVLLDAGPASRVARSPQPPRAPGCCLRVHLDRAHAAARPQPGGAPRVASRLARRVPDAVRRAPADRVAHRVADDAGGTAARHLTQIIRSAEDAGVSQGVAAGLRVDAQAVRAGPDRDPGEQVAGARVQRVDDAAVAPGQPQHLAVRRQPTHVGATAAGYLPGVRHLAAAQVDDADAVATAVRDVEPRRGAVDVEAVRSRARVYEADLAEALRVDDLHTGGVLVGDVHHLAVR